MILIKSISTNRNHNLNEAANCCSKKVKERCNKADPKAKKIEEDDEVVDLDLRSVLQDILEIDISDEQMDLIYELLSSIYEEDGEAEEEEEEEEIEDEEEEEEDEDEIYAESLRFRGVGSLLW